MEYIFYLFINSLEGFLSLTILSLILFFILNLILHMFLNFLKKNDDMFWPSLIKSTKHFAFFIIFIEFMIGIPFHMIHIHMMSSEFYSEFIIYLVIFIGRFTLLSISCIFAFTSMKNCDFAGFLNKNKKILICFIFCAPYLYVLNTVKGVSSIFLKLLPQ